MMMMMMMVMGKSFSEKSLALCNAENLIRKKYSDRWLEVDTFYFVNKHHPGLNC